MTNDGGLVQEVVAEVVVVVMSFTLKSDLLNPYMNSACYVPSVRSFEGRLDSYHHFIDKGIYTWLHS